MSGRAGRVSLALNLVLVGFFALSGCTRSHEPSQTSGADVDAIIRYNGQLLKALNDGDAEAMNALMADDYVIFLPGRPPVQGIEAIRASNRSFLAQWHDVETWTPDETVVAGDLGFQRGKFDLQLTPKAGGPMRSVSGSYLHVYQRKPDGAWRLTRAMTTTLPEKKAAPLSADDRLAIMNLIAHYAQNLDSGDAAAYAANFTTDGVAEWANGSARGREAIAKWVGGLMKAGGIGATPAQVRHFVNMPDIAGDSERATARTYVTIFGLNKAGAVNVPSVASYTDTLVKQDGHWLFEKRVMKADLGVFAKRAD